MIPVETANHCWPAQRYGHRTRTVRHSNIRARCIPNSDLRIPTCFPVLRYARCYGPVLFAPSTPGVLPCAPGDVLSLGPV